jgi:hypothetical protein
MHKPLSNLEEAADIMRQLLQLFKDNIAVVTVVVTIAVAFSGYLATYVNNRLIARAKDRLELVNKRLNEFYGPLYVANRAGRIAYLSLCEKFDRSPIFVERGQSLPKEELDEWYIWVRNVFMPLNEVCEKIIVEKAYLILEEEMPECLLDLVSHVVGYRAVIAKWDKGDFSENLSLIDFPADALGSYLTQSYAELKHQQRLLLKGL